MVLRLLWIYPRWMMTSPSATPSAAVAPAAAAAVAPTSATAAATAAVPPEEHGPAQAAPGPTTADLLAFYRRIAKAAQSR